MHVIGEPPRAGVSPSKAVMKGEIPLLHASKMAGRAAGEAAAGYKQLVGKKLRVKLGKSFRDRSNNAFHTISYDFKPKSIDSTQSERLKTLKGGGVEVSIPNVQAETADDVTTFRGAVVPAQKECLLMIDLHSGEAILERITNKVNLKVVRSARKQQRLLPAAKERPVSPSVPPPKQGSQLPGPSGSAPGPGSGVGVAAVQGKGKQPRPKKRAMEAPSSSSSSLPRPTKLSKAKVKKQPKVSERKKPPVEPQKPICPPSPPVDVPQKRPFPPLSSPSSSDNDSGEEDDPLRSALATPKPSQECMRSGEGGVAQQTMTGFPPQTAVASSSSSDSDSSSDASSSDGEQQDGSQGITKATSGQKQAPVRSISVLNNDLQLSSYSDSDSS